MSLAQQAWEAQHPPETLEDVLRRDQELRERAKALGVWLDTIRKIEGEQ